MHVTAGNRQYTFDPNTFLNVELIAVERFTGMNAFKFQNGLNEGSFLAATALVWILEKRQGNILAFDAIEFPATSFEITPEDDVEVKASSPETYSDTPPAPVRVENSTTTTPPDFLNAGV
jgi:hypothetical protein